ncbi:hypothetical protein ABIB40_000470 [Pedobacter sp. UYP30]|uniref:hypothetical protein n=1 Tax=Pedobacter sp. UYP30 TaxID=1756400 RepID=UPI003390A5BA
MNIEFKQPRDFGQIINDTFTFVRQNFKPLIKTYFLFCGIFVLGSMVAMLMQQYKSVILINSAGGPGATRDPLLGLKALMSWEYLIAIIFSVATYVSMLTAILSYIALYVRKGNIAPSIEEVWPYFKYYFFRIFGSALPLLLMLGVGFIFCLIPGFYLFPFVAMIFPIIIIENGEFGYSFSRSFKIIKDNFWLTFGSMIVIWIIVYACMSAVVLPTTLFSMIGLFSKSSPHMSLALTMATTILQSLCQVFTIIPLVTITLCYFSLVERKESTGLMERISNFGTGNDPLNLQNEEY